MSALHGEARALRIKERLSAALAPVELELRDDSADHAGHGAAGGHYTVRIVAAAFRDKTTLERHRMVYRALGDLDALAIHALSIRAEAPPA